MLNSITSTSSVFVRRGYRLVSYFFVCSLFLLMSCGDSDNIRSSFVSQDSSDSQNLLDIKSQVESDFFGSSFLDTKFDGRYITKCNNSDSSTSSLSKIELKSPEITIIRLEFSGKDCNIEKLLSRNLIKFIYTLNKEISDAQIIKVNMDSISSKLTLYDNILVESFNSEQLYEISDWAIAVEKDITQPLKKASLLDDDFTPYFIVKIDEKTLYMNEYWPSKDNDNIKPDDKESEIYYKVNTKTPKDSLVNSQQSTPFVLAQQLTPFYLNGEYTSKCFNEGDDEYYIEKLTITNTQMTENISTYSDPDCKSQLPIT